MSTVIITPEPHWQFLDLSGKPLSNGFIFTYDAGTTNLRNTFTDSSGLIQNPNPIPLDASGSPSNGSVQTGIWLANQAYKFVAYNSAMVQQWSSDNISGYFGLLNMANVWTLGQTFNSPITVTPVDNQIVTGVSLNQTTLDYPPPVGNITLHFPNTTDTMVGRATTDTLSNKTFSDSPKVNGTMTVVSIVGLSNTVTTQTGDTALHTMYTIAVPGNILGLTRMLRIWVMMTVNVAAGNPVVQVNYGGTRISANVALTAAYVANESRLLTVGGNSGATNAQTWDQTFESIGGGGTGAYAGHQTSAIDSTVNQNITVTYQGGANSDSITFYRCIVELL